MGTRHATEQTRTLYAPGSSSELAFGSLAVSEETHGFASPPRDGFALSGPLFVLRVNYIKTYTSTRLSN